MYGTSVPGIVAIEAVRFYQGYISPLLREDKCNFAPTCSGYSLQAIRERGAMKGLVMTFDRLSRCHGWARKEGYRTVGTKLYDPVKDAYW